MTIRRFLASAFFTMVLATPMAGFCLDLESAKGSGVVGEEPSGYLGVVVASPEARELVESINQKRREMYAEIAKKNGTSVSAVEALAGKKAIDASKPGSFVRGAGGEWQRR